MAWDSENFLIDQGALKSFTLFYLSVEDSLRRSIVLICGVRDETLITIFELNFTTAKFGVGTSAISSASVGDTTYIG